VADRAARPSAAGEYHGVPGRRVLRSSLGARVIGPGSLPKRELGRAYGWGTSSAHGSQRPGASIYARLEQDCAVWGPARAQIRP